jgi:23S rRNA (cytosine1962-C5)-methyltransferase
MNTDVHLMTDGWEEYQLLDSGDGMKLERFGEVVTARPETQALWSKRRPELWREAHAVFEFAEKKGQWKARKSMPESWEMRRGPLTFSAKLSGFKHTGVFPEQEPNWVWIKDRVKDFVSPSSAPEVLNLFGYTGVATLAAAHPGAHVTHVDASKQSLDWAHDNARRTRIPEDRIRWMLEDALAFAKREARRGTAYDGIILDPPAFGRGSKGEVWHIEEDLPSLLSVLKGLLKGTPGSFFLMNGYAAGYAPRAFSQAVESAFGPVEGESGELHIKEASSERVIPSGIYARFVR